MVPIGRQVRRIRRERELSQTALANAAGMALNSVNRIEKGHMNPSAESVMRIADALGVPVGVLYEERELVLPKDEAPAMARPETQYIAPQPATEGEYGPPPTFSYKRALRLITNQALSGGVSRNEVAEALEAERELVLAS